jgi:hypothetical protein
VLLRTEGRRPSAPSADLASAEATIEPLGA